jgi:6-phosphogluconate dehydrogenase
MRIGLIGLGKMGGNMVQRLIQRDHEVVAFDLDEDAVSQAADHGALGAESVEDLVSKLDPPRVVWVMVPHGEPTRKAIREVLNHVQADDLVVDGGNSHYTESMEHARACGDQSVQFLDIGMSGGVWGLEVGYCLMAGGPAEAFHRVEPVLKALAPEEGYALVGGNGAGHFVKMIHNAIEYAMLEAIGEGFEGLVSSEFDLDLREIADLWTHGSVIRSWLLELLARAFDREGDGLDEIAPFVEESGTGRWTAEFALKEGVPMPNITLALFERFASQRPDRFSHRVIAALRNQFGGHAVRRTHQEGGK